MSASAARVEARANAAASEAARDARAEVIKEASTAKVNGVSKKAAAAAVKNGWYHFVLDVWITNFNSFEFGLYKRSRNRAKSRQFTADMDIIADVTEGGERLGVIGYREDLWKNAEEMDKRLVLKMFTESLSWRASMELLIGRSLQQTIASRGLPVMAYSINNGSDEFIIYVERSANKWPFMPENFAFFIMKDGGCDFYRFKRDFINLGGDYTLYDQHDKKIGHLDGKVLSIGGKWKGRLLVEHADRRLLTVMQLFSAMIIFNGGCRRHMKRLWRDVRKGKIQPKIESQETDLYMNPRRLR